MVFCNLLNRDGDVLLYAIGGTPEDLTGRLQIDLSKKSYKLSQEPKRTKVRKRHLECVIAKILNLFDAGEVRDKVSYEIG